MKQMKRRKTIHGQNQGQIIAFPASCGCGGSRGRDGPPYAFMRALGTANDFCAWTEPERIWLDHAGNFLAEPVLVRIMNEKVWILDLERLLAHSGSIGSFLLVMSKPLIELAYLALNSIAFHFSDVIFADDVKNSGRISLQVFLACNCIAIHDMTRNDVALHDMSSLCGCRRVSHLFH